VHILWENTKNLIQEKMTKQNFETWIKPIQIASMDESQVVLTVPNRFFKDWLKENHYRTINECLTSVIGYDVKILFTISQEKKEKSASDSHKPLEQKHVPVSTTSKKHKIEYHYTLNPHYNFDRFVIGSSNQFAHAASTAVAEHPAKNYNPFFIYGGVGLGKTHLINAIGLLTYSLYPEMNVLYVSAEEFINELISSIRHDKMPKFREKYRNIDCLIIDDIQFIAGKDRTQEEFFHTFNTLHDSGKQIVMTSDNSPKDIPNLEERLRSRFEWGLIADIQVPEIETKIAIIEKKAHENNVILPHDAATYIATCAESNIRELEGFLTQSIAYASLTKRKIDLDLVKQVLAKILKPTEQITITTDDILKGIADHFKIKVSDLKSPNKSKKLATSRQIAMHLCRKLTSASFPDIGEKFGGRDHSTVIYADKKIKKLIETNTDFKTSVQSIEDKLIKKR
jgi:chromosomal replication initiator protein